MRPSLAGTTVAVLVQADLGRSPRMLAHCLELVRHGAQVELVGYEGSDLPQSITAHPKITVHRVHEFRIRDQVPRFLFAPAVAADIGLTAPALNRALQPPADVTLLQLPPSVGWASAVVAQAVVARALHRRKPVVLDWHNLGSTQLREPALARFHDWHDVHIARACNAHLAASPALAHLVQRKFGVSTLSLPDLPRSEFLAARGATLNLEKLYKELDLPPAAARDGTYLLAPSSFGRDDELPLLLQAAASLEPHAARAHRQIVIIASGRGPLQTVWQHRLRHMALPHVHLRTHWASADDYPRLVAGARLGLSFHRSTSGADLAIKVVDFLAAGVPVCALDSSAASETLCSSAHGRTFRDAAELTSHLVELLLVAPESLTHMTHQLRLAAFDTWQARWATVALPLLLAVLARHR